MDLNGGRLNGWSDHERRSGFSAMTLALALIEMEDDSSVVEVVVEVETDRAVVKIDGNILEARMNAGWGWWARVDEEAV